MTWIAIALGTSLLISILAHLLHWQDLRVRIEGLLEHMAFLRRVIELQEVSQRLFDSSELTELDLGTEEPPAVVQQKLQAWNEGSPE